MLSLPLRIMSTKSEGSRPVVVASASSSFAQKKSQLFIGFGVVAGLLWVSAVNFGGGRGLDTDHNVMPVQNMNVARHADRGQSAVASRFLKDEKMQKKVSRIHRVLALPNT